MDENVSSTDHKNTNYSFGAFINMGILSASVSVTRYRVEGSIENPFMETVRNALKKNAIVEIDEEDTEKSVGWTSFDNPFVPDFEGDSFLIGPYLIFSLRIDKKSVPQKVVRKHVMIETAKKLAESGRDFLSRMEKNTLKENVINALSRRVLATPDLYDVLWNHENGMVWFFSNQKGANEELETLFKRAFGLTLIRLFPYTFAFFSAGLSDDEKDALSLCTPLKFVE